MAERISPMKVAVIGAGGAGLTTAWLLDGSHTVTLYEKEDRLGGHAHTITIDVHGKEVGIDGGFEFFSDRMFPGYMRLLNLLKVPLTPFPMLVTMFNTQNGAGYLMPPFHGWQVFPAGFAPRKIADLLRFTSILRAARSIIETSDVTITAGQFLDRLNIPEDFRDRFMYPYLQAGWGVSRDDIKTFAAYDILKYSVLNTPATVIPNGWKEIEGGTQTYVKAVAESFRNIQVKLGAGVTAIERVETGFRVIDTLGQANVYDHIVLATNANQAAEALTPLAGTEEMRNVLNRIRYFETTIAVHGDTRLMPPLRKHWSTVNIRYDGQFSQLTMWKRWKSEVPVFKSWVTYDKMLPEPLYAVAKYLHPRVDLNYFSAQKQLQSFQGKDNIWLAGMYMVDVDCHESAVLSAINVVRRLAPQSERLHQLMPDEIEGK
jgi:predicted NAD/FAD-binding protein